MKKQLLGGLATLLREAHHRGTGLIQHHDSVKHAHRYKVEHEYRSHGDKEVTRSKYVSAFLEGIFEMTVYEI